jgi:hypothetical protein
MSNLTIPVTQSNPGIRCHVGHVVSRANVGDARTGVFDSRALRGETYREISTRFAAYRYLPIR